MAVAVYSFQGWSRASQVNLGALPELAELGVDGGCLRAGPAVTLSRLVACLEARPEQMCAAAARHLRKVAGFQARLILPA